MVIYEIESKASLKLSKLYNLRLISLFISFLMLLITSFVSKNNGVQERTRFRSQVNLSSINLNNIFYKEIEYKPTIKTNFLLDNKNSSVFKAAFSSLSVVLVSEIGDKTFFIAAIMSMKHPRLTVYTGAISALGLMTLLSALLGNILTQFIPRTYTYYASSFLFAIFGLKMLRESYGMTHADSNEEYEEASISLI